MVICIKHKAQMSAVSLFPDICEECLVDATNISLANFGTSEYHICGCCGDRFNKEDFVSHLEALKVE